MPKSPVSNVRSVWLLAAKAEISTGLSLEAVTSRGRFVVRAFGTQSTRACKSCQCVQACGGNLLRFLIVSARQYAAETKFHPRSAAIAVIKRERDRSDPQAERITLLSRKTLTPCLQYSKTSLHHAHPRRSTPEGSPAKYRAPASLQQVAEKPRHRATPATSWDFLQHPTPTPSSPLAAK